MDQYGQIGPDKPGYKQDLLEIAEHLRAGRAVALEHSYRMTLTKLVLLPAIATVRHGGPAAAELLITVVGKGADWLALYGDLHWTDARQYLGITNEVDATAIADLLNALAHQMMDRAVQREGVTHG